MDDKTNKEIHLNSSTDEIQLNLRKSRSRSQKKSLATTHYLISEENEYIQAFDKLYDQIHISEEKVKSDLISQAAAPILEQIEELEEALPDESSSHSKRQSYINVLNETYTLITDPNPLTHLSPYQELAERAEGASQKLAGTMLGLVGAVIIVSSVFFALASFGLSSPLTAIGITIGITVLAKAASFMGIAVGIGISFAGLYLFGRQELSRSMIQLANTVAETNLRRLSVQS